MDIIPEKKESNFRDLPLYKVRIDYKNQEYEANDPEIMHIKRLMNIKIGRPIKNFWRYLKKYNIKEYNKSKKNIALYKGFIQLLEETQKPIRTYTIPTWWCYEDSSGGITLWDWIKEIEVRKEINVTSKTRSQFLEEEIINIIRKKTDS